MDYVTCLFYLFAVIILISSLLVVLSSNTLYAVLSLMTSFLGAAGLFLLVKAEFLAMTLVIVYVGAVAIFFLFVIMMMQTDEDQQKRRIQSYLLSVMGAGLFLFALVQYIQEWYSATEAFSLVSIPQSMVSKLTNTEAIGKALYTFHFLPFQTLGLILCVGMIGAILLTLRLREDKKRQRLGDQLGRHSKETILLKDIPFFSGVSQHDGD